jgi:4-diphosphocytidyl-2-C-methyl-D-erythritol kinase
MPLSDKQTVFAPAKVNLHLAVKDRRHDGFHNLESIFVKLDFGDKLHFLPVNNKNSTKINMEFEEKACFNGNISLADIPQEDNIIFKAVSLFRSRTGFDQGLNINVEKRIPCGSGLGGGSSNAASTLLVLNKMAGFPLDLGGLLEAAATLGSDVPFFIYETSAAWVTGRGECIKPLETPHWLFVLVIPNFSSNTAIAFRLLDNFRLASSASIRESLIEIKNYTVPSRFSEINFADMYNDFLPVFPEHEKSVYNGIISQLKELGADFAGLSGSGSACFGVFNEKTRADNVVLNLEKKWKFVKICGTG